MFLQRYEKAEMSLPFLIYTLFPTPAEAGQAFPLGGK